MDINEIVDMQSDSAVESTLESEIDALSKIITDTKDGSQKLDDNDDEFKLDGDDLVFTASLQCDSMESDNCELLSNNTLDIKNILDNPEEIENFMSTSTNDNSLQDLLKETVKTDDQENDSTSQESKDGTKILEGESTNNDNNLSLISEVYNSQESQSSIEDELTSTSNNLEEVKDIENEQSNTMDTEFASTSSEDKQVLPSSSNEMCENDRDISNFLKEETNNETNSEILEKTSLQEHVNESIDECESIQNDCKENEEFSIQNYPLKSNENNEGSRTVSPMKENTEIESIRETEDLNAKNENNIESSKTLIEKADASLEKITEQKIENADIFTNIDETTTASEVSENVEKNIGNSEIEDTVSENIDENVDENVDETVDENIDENVDENIDENIGENMNENMNENSNENIGENMNENTNENSNENIDENIDEKNIASDLPENIEQNIEDFETIEENVSENIDQNTPDFDMPENVEQNIEDYKIEYNANLDKSIEEELISKKDIAEVTEPDNESVDITNVETNTVQEEISEESNKLDPMDTDNVASADTEDVEMNDVHELQNFETSIEAKKEETSIEDKNEETRIEDKNEETSIEDKKEETSIKNEKEESSIEDKKEETSIEHRKEESSIEDKKEEKSIEDRKEEISIEDKKEETSIEYRKEEISIEDKKEETRIEDIKNTNTEKEIADLEQQEENIKSSQNVEIDDSIKITQNDKNDTNSEDTKSTDVDAEPNEINEVLQSIESNSNDILMEKEVIDVAESIEHIESSECLEEIDHGKMSSKNIDEKLINSDIDTNNKALQETDTISDVSIAQDKNIKEVKNSQVLQNTDTVSIDNKDTGDDESNDKKINISVKESTLINVTLNENEIQSEKFLEQHLTIESNEKEEQDLITVESKEEYEVDIHSIKSSVLRDDNTPHDSTNIDKGSSEHENLNNEFKKPIDENISEQNLTVIERESMKEDLTLARVETPEDLNITLELEESEISEKLNTAVSKVLQDDNESKLEKEMINVGLQEPSEEKEEHHLNSEEIEDQVDINLSLDPDNYSSPNQDLPDDPMILIDPLDPLGDLVDNVVDTENVDAIEAPETSEAIENNLSEILDINKKNDQFIHNDQKLDSQDIATSFINEVEKELGSDFNEFLETEENIDDVVKDFTIAEPVDSPSSAIQAFNEKLEDPLSEFSELEALPSKSISINQESTENKESSGIEKEEDISLVFEESSQSPKGTEDNDKFANDPSDLFGEISDTLENITECNQSESVNEKNKENIEKEEADSIIPSSEISSGLEGNEQLDEIQTSEIISKAIINDTDKEETMHEASDEISELESAVKFLQESEEQDIQASSMNKEETIIEDNSSIFVAVEDSICDNATELVSDLPEVDMDPIAISEAEIISEAAKLESERKKKMELQQLLEQENKDINNPDNLDKAEICTLSTVDNLLSIVESNEKTLSTTTNTTREDLDEISALTSDVIEETKSISETSSQVSMIDERYKEPPKIESPEVAAPKISDLPSTPRASLIQKDAKLRLESPERAGSAEPRITDTPKKDVEKQQYSECENVGSPRIILKIAKSAIADCSEPRSPKSPKIRSAANSPNPEDSPGHKLGKIKLKLSKGGHPSIIPNNDNFDETAQWHTDSTSSLSPLGMKIKLTKSSDASSMDYKHEEHEETKEKVSHKSDEGRKSETSIGMKIKLSKSGDASIVQQDGKETSQEIVVTKKQDSPSIGMKIKLSKSGDASIIQQDSKGLSTAEDSRENIGKTKEKLIDDTQDIPRRTDSPLGMKIKLSKSGDTATVISNDPLDIENEEPAKRTDSPIGVKIKLAKTKGGTASIISNEISEEVKEKVDMAESSKKFKSSKRREISEDTSEIVGSDIVPSDSVDETSKGSIGMKIKFSKAGDASVVSTIKEDDTSKKSAEQPLGMKIKLSKTGDPSIIHSKVSKEAEDIIPAARTKHSKNKDHSNTSQQKSKDDSHLEMKIKLSKTGHPTIINTSELQETTLKTFKKSHSDVTIEAIKHQTVENTMIDLHNKRKEITIAPIESKKAKVDSNLKQMLPDITIQPIIPAAKKEQQLQQQQRKLLLESNNANISQQQMNVINQEISITQMLNRTINDECKLPQICSLATGDTLMGERLKSALNLPGETSASSPLNSDCEIIEPIQPELIIVNENSNSSQDVMIIDEVPSVKTSIRAPKKRGRPRRNANVAVPMSSITPGVATGSASFQELDLQRDPLSLDQPPMLLPMQLSSIPLTAQSMQSALQQHQSQLQPQVLSAAGTSAVASTEGSERPRRTCRSQKSYAPPKRGRGRGRGKRKNEAVDIPMKKQRIDQDLTAIEASTTAVIALEKLPIEAATGIATPSELFKALNQPTLDRVPSQRSEVEILDEPEAIQSLPQRDDIEMTVQEEIPEKIQPEVQESIEDDVIEFDEVTTTVPDPSISATITTTVVDSDKDVLEVTDIVDDKADEIQVDQDKSEVIPILKVTDEEKQHETVIDQSEAMETNKDSLIIQEHQNWLAPSIKKVSGDSVTRNESISTLTVIDEETRMSAESGSRSQTPARNMTIPGTAEPILNEESQGSVLSTATTESEKVKVKNRRMEISFDPDEGPFTVEKIAEYEWPLKEDRPAGRGDTSMIQEQISQYLGVKSFKRKYPDLKRRMVDMEERNFLRENGLVSESMCDMGLTAVSSSEVLDIMCNDFPEQYEEYRKHMREKAAKEHSKKQKELSAAANAERNRIDLAEMAMQSAISWNAGLNKARQDLRKCSLDLQTFTVHMPKRPTKLDPSRRCNTYPVALIPGQYTEYYREYTPAELRYYPLNTVLYGPMRPNERKLDSQSEGSQSDSDSDSSSDDSSSSSSEGTHEDTEGSQSTMDEVDMELAVQSDVKCKMCLNNLNKNNRPEVLIQCGTCNGNVHPSCIDLTLDMVPHIRAYAWQCTDCKTCAQCHDPADEDKMLFCDMCDRGYHIYCVGLRRVPQGRWHCQECAVCANCGSKEPGGANSDRNSVAQWQHEYKKGDKNTRVYVSTFCVPCSKLWRKGRYCPHCSRCHNVPRLDLEPNLVHCAACDKYLHLGCVETKGVIIDKKHYLCDFCSPNRQQLVKPLISKTFKT